MKVPIFKTSSISPEFYDDPSKYKNIDCDCAEPTNRLLSGTDDHWAEQEWVEPVFDPDGSPAKKYYLFSKKDIIDEDGNPIDSDDFAWDSNHVSKIEIEDE